MYMIVEESPPLFNEEKFEIAQEENLEKGKLKAFIDGLFQHICYKTAPTYLRPNHTNENYYRKGDWGGGTTSFTAVIY